jgi:hypothetical protein
MIRSSGNPLLHHSWGKSQAQDVVLARISGMAPSLRGWERPFMVLQVFIDESYSQDSTFVLGGYIASVEAWGRFAKEWEELLPLARKGNSGLHRFKMSEMARDLKSVAPFYHVIEKHVLMSIACRINISQFNRALERIWIPERRINWSGVNPNVYMMMYFLTVFYESRYRKTFDIFNDLIPSDERVECIFDDINLKAAVIGSWDDFKRHLAPEELQGIWGPDPRFEDDEIFLPLQAADFWAWCVRDGFENNRFDSYKQGDFGAFRGTIRIRGIEISADEDQLADSLRRAAERDAGPGISVYDAKFDPPDKPLPRPSEGIWAQILRFVRR